jgi:riboflavin kinase/FMN adenylyltransferase
VNIYHNIESTPFLQRGGITIGTFEGVHKAHHVVLEKVSQIAKSIKGTSIVISFSSHPRKVINPDFPLNILTTQEEKNVLFQAIGIDTVIYIDFTQTIADMSYIDFIRFLSQKIEIKKMIVGYDHNFGKNKEGNISNLKKLVPLFGFEIIEIPKQTINGIEVSSSSIRKAINNKDMKLANQLLVSNYQLETRLISRTVTHLVVTPTDKDKIIPPQGKYHIKMDNENACMEIRNDLMYIYPQNSNTALINKENPKITVEFFN